MIRFIFLWCFSWVSLVAESEYDIVLLAPVDQELTSFATFAPEASLNESGYAWGNIFFNGQEESTSFIYHIAIGLKLITPPMQSEYSFLTSVNAQGNAVGIYGRRNTNYWDNSNAFESLFVYRLIDNSYLDILDVIQKNVDEFKRIRVLSAGITDLNQIIFSIEKEGLEEVETYLFNMETQSYCLFSDKTALYINAKMQMAGSSSKGAWFFDSQIGERPIDSLDQFKRWDVMPQAISLNGYVAGQGRDSFNEMKGFVWSQKLGLKSFDLLSDWINVKGVNDKGEVVGYFEIASRSHDYEHAFFYNDDIGVIDLGTLEGGRSSQAAAINNHSQVVGTYTTKRGFDRAFIWDIEHGMRSLTTLISENTGWKTLDMAFGIIDDGSIIGVGNYYGVNHYFLLIPKKGEE